MADQNPGSGEGNGDEDLRGIAGIERTEELKQLALEMGDANLMPKFLLMRSVGCPNRIVSGDTSPVHTNINDADAQTLLGALGGWLAYERRTLTDTAEHIMQGETDEAGVTEVLAGLGLTLIIVRTSEQRTGQTMVSPVDVATETDRVAGLIERTLAGEEEAAGDLNEFLFCALLINFPRG